jgi:hypothetical protein
MRLLLFISFFVFTTASGQTKKAINQGTVVCELPVEKRCITINDGKPLFVSYVDKSYRGLIVVEGSLDTSTLTYTGQRIIFSRLNSKVNTNKKLELEFGDKPAKNQSYLVTVLPELNNTLKKIKFKFARHGDCKIYTSYRFRVTLK